MSLPLFFLSFDELYYRFSFSLYEAPLRRRKGLGRPAARTISFFFRGCCPPFLSLIPISASGAGLAGKGFRSSCRFVDAVFLLRLQSLNVVYY